MPGGSPTSSVPSMSKLTSVTGANPVACEPPASIGPSDIHILRECVARGPAGWTRCDRRAPAVARPVADLTSAPARSRAAGHTRSSSGALDRFAEVRRGGPIGRPAPARLVVYPAAHGP